MAFTQPIAFATIENALVDWLRSSTAIAVLWAKQNRPQTTKPFVVLKRVSGPIVIGRDEQRRRMVGDELFTDIIGQREMTYNVQAFCSSDKANESAESYLALAQATIEHDSIIDKFELAKIGVVNIGPIASLDSIAGAGFESRASFDLTISTVSALIAAADSPTNWIETADVSELEE